MSSTNWIKSSFCQSDGCMVFRRVGDDAVEMAITRDGVVSPRGVLTEAEWKALKAGMSAGDFNAV